LIITFAQLVFFVDISGCFWFTDSTGNIANNINWVTANDLEDSSIISKYIVSLYWATVTCTTVGYGDILPTNNFELFWAMIIIIFGVAYFSYILSNLASQFMEISKTNANN
jgi:hypothetical protein